jgi:heterodisulfide reductase subunit A-like polyferredoxin
MLRVRKDLCVGCGLCTESCPRGAISVQSGQAQIDQARCNRCGICLDVCPQRAIVEMVPVSQDELEATVSSLKQRANKLTEKIESLRRLR